MTFSLFYIILKIYNWIIMVLINIYFFYCDRVCIWNYLFVEIFFSMKGININGFIGNPKRTEVQFKIYILKPKPNSLSGTF